MQLRKRGHPVNYSEIPSLGKNVNSTVSDDIEDSEIDSDSDDFIDDSPEQDETDVKLSSKKRRIASKKSKRGAEKEKTASTLLKYAKPNVSNCTDRRDSVEDSQEETEEGDGDDDEDFVAFKDGERKRRIVTENRNRVLRSRKSEGVNYKDASSSDDDQDGLPDTARRPGKLPDDEDQRSSPETSLPSLDNFAFTKPANVSKTVCQTPSSINSSEVSPSDGLKTYSRRVKNRFVIASDDDDIDRKGSEKDRPLKAARKLVDTDLGVDKPAKHSTGECVDGSPEREEHVIPQLNTITANPEPLVWTVDMYGVRFGEGDYGPLSKRINRIEKILAVRGSSSGSPIYCVKLPEKSYRQVVNVDESTLQKCCPQLLRSFQKRMSLLQRVDGHPGDHAKSPAFSPQFLKIDRVINRITAKNKPDKNNRSERSNYLYYVKWCGLPYSEATWEKEQELSSGDRQAIERFVAYNAKPTRGKYGKKLKLHFRDGRSLRDYQEEGLAWLDNKYMNRVNCILADEMGLGKTIQSVAMLETIRTKHSIRGPFLVIAPVSTLGHWQREVESLTDMNCVVYSGTQDDRDIIRQYEFHYPHDNKRSELKFNVLLTSFEMVMKDQVKLSKFAWQYLIVDEAHRLKSRESKTAQSLRQMEVIKGGLLLLTGTPVQNNTKEIFSLLNLLDSEQFSSEEEFLTKYGDLKNAEQVKDLQENVLRPRLLRRMKEDVEKSIPLKEETIVWVELTREQRSYYRAIFENSIATLLKGSQNSNLPNLRNVAMELRKLCNHPFLCNGLEEDMLAKTRRLESAQDLSKDGGPRVEKLLCQASGKMVLVDKLLPMLKDAGRRVLIFSQFTMMLDLLEDYLVSKGYSFERIDGNIRGPERQAAIDRYSAKESEIFVFLLSTRAGGLGITLTAADTCIIYDSDWNPQNDLQAMARCHRIGQTKDVKIYRLITRNTYEQRLFECSSRKYGLDEAILGNRVGADGDGDLEQGKNIESLLKHGAYDILKEDGEAEAAEFSAQNINHILEHRTQKRLIGGRGANTFSVATFVSNPELDNELEEEMKAKIDKGSEEFWEDLLPEACRASRAQPEWVPQPLGGPRRKRSRAQVDYREDQRVVTNDRSSDTASSVQANESADASESDVSVEDGIKSWSDRELKRLEDRLMALGKNRTMQVREEAQLEHRNFYEVEAMSEFMIQLCHYLETKGDTLNSSAPGSTSKDEAEKPYADESGGKGVIPDATDAPDIIPVDCMLFNNFSTGVNYRKDEFLAYVTRPIPPGFARKAIRSRAFNDRIQRNAARYVQALHEREVLADAISKNNTAYLPPHVPIRSKKIPSWWGAQEDLDLLIGVHRHGHRDFKKVKMDPTLCFAKRATTGSRAVELIHGSKEENGSVACEPNVLDCGSDGDDGWPSDMVVSTRLKKLIESLPNGLSQRDRNRRIAKTERERKRVFESRPPTAMSKQVKEVQLNIAPGSSNQFQEDTAAKVSANVRAVGKGSLESTNLESVLSKEIRTAANFWKSSFSVQATAPRVDGSAPDVQLLGNVINLNSWVNINPSPGPFKPLESCHIQQYKKRDTMSMPSRMPSSGNAEDIDILVADMVSQKQLRASDGPDAPQLKKNPGKENEVPLRKSLSLSHNSMKVKDGGLDNGRQRSIIGFLSSKLAFAS